MGRNEKRLYRHEEEPLRNIENEKRLRLLQKATTGQSAANN